MIPMAISLMSIIEVMMDLTNKRKNCWIVFLGFCLLGDVSSIFCQAYGIHHHEKLPCSNMSNEKNTGCLVYIGDYTTQLHRILINHCKDPY